MSSSFKANSCVSHDADIPPLPQPGAVITVTAVAGYQSEDTISSSSLDVSIDAQSQAIAFVAPPPPPACAENLCRLIHKLEDPGSIEDSVDAIIELIINNLRVETHLMSSKLNEDVLRQWQSQ